MITEAMSSASATLQKMPRPSEQIESNRKSAKEQPQPEQAQAESKKVQPEEILTQIKALTEDGLYSVRFENDDRSKELVVKIVDVDTQEVIRQVPAEELLGMKAALEDLQGKLVDVKS